MRLKDISLSKTEFFLRKMESSTQDLRKVFWEDFKNIISCIEKEAEGNTHGQTDYQNLEDPPFQQGRITPILSSPWVEKKSNKFLRRFISRVFLDVFSLQIFLCRVGEITIEKLENVAQELLAELSILKEKINKERSQEIKTRNNTLKSECLCYWIEFIDSKDIEKFADDIFERIFGATTFKEIDFSFAKVAFVEVNEDIDFCILVKDLKKATIFFNDLLPEYFLSWSKVKNEESILKQKLIEEKKENLIKVLEGKNQKRTTLQQIEEMSFELAEKRTAFAEELSDMEFHLRTLEVNISNAEKLLSKSLIIEQKDTLKEVWIKPLRLVAEQTNVYLSYYKIILEKSRITGEKISNDANLKSAIYSRRLSFLFGLFSLIGILQLFPDSFGKIADYQKVIILSVTVLIFLFAAFRSEIRSWFKKS